MPNKIVVALGGNAISSGKFGGDIPSQFAQSRVTAVHIADLIEAGHHVLLTHGNGPQVGTVLRRVELSRNEVYPIDLGLCVADTQAGMGYMICQCIRNEMVKRTSDVTATTIVTTVRVNPNDPAFDNPSKPIGQFYDQETIRLRIASDRWVVKHIPNKGYRRVVPSPKPQEILEIDLIHELFDEGRVIVCCGGGGIPCIQDPSGGYEGIEAVIDKDLTAALLASEVDADTLAILTDVERVCLDYGTPDEKELDTLTVDEARKYRESGQFPDGSMGPKVDACVDFLDRTENPNARAIITSITSCLDALEGKAGTHVVRSR
ncbi:MAG TPA: carbamate kinase [Phycisphaerae bacterium]|nr:carbamate kinase [Phycisphaerales bacterium]HNO77809.1 carbamate kinase [Phycisphaerae bacterium]